MSYNNNGGFNSASAEFNPNANSGKPQFFSSKKMNQTDDAGFKIERTVKSDAVGTQAAPVTAPAQ
jgi:hypothetical protein